MCQLFGPKKTRQAEISLQRSCTLKHCLSLVSSGAHRWKVPLGKKQSHATGTQSYTVMPFGTAFGVADGNYQVATWGRWVLYDYPDGLK